MENSSRLYDTVVSTLRQHKKWLDMRHLYTLAWMVVGLRCTASRASSIRNG